MTCPRCSIGEIAEDTGACTLCGFAPAKPVSVHRPVVDEVQETVQRELEGRFRINVLLRHGTRSVVYLADEVETGRLVALKVVPLQRGLQVDATSFERQASLAESIEHSHIVQLLGYGKTRALLWYSMEYVEGRSLADLLRESGKLDLPATQRIIEQVGSALDYLHRRGITHGNLKPDNILVDANGWARLSDACVMSAFRPSIGTHPKRVIIGTPEYLAPEQFHVRTVGASADQYALAIITFECLAGSLPFVGDSPDELERHHLNEPAPSLDGIAPGLPQHVCEAVRRALAKIPAERFPTVLDFVAMMRREWVPQRSAYLTPEGRPNSPSQVFFIETPRRRLPWLVISIVAVVVIGITGAGMWFAMGGRPEAPLGLEPSRASVNRQSPPPAASAATEQPPAQAAAGAPQGADEPRPRVAAAPPGAEPARVSPAAAPGRVLLNATPWGQIFLDEELVGNTPQALDVPAGRHTIRIVREGFVTFVTEIEVAPAQQIRLTNITLEPQRP